MSESGTAVPMVSLEQLQKEWPLLRLRVEQLEAGNKTLEADLKALRSLLERVIEHRQRSHNELVLLLAGLVTKLPMNDVGGIVAKLVEHNTNVTQYLAALSKGSAEMDMPQPVVLRSLEESRRELLAAQQPLLEELLRLETPLEQDLLEALRQDPEQFFSPRMVRANRCFIKGQVARERVVRDFGQEVLGLFNDLTTDPKLNPRPKPEEIMLGFKSDFEALLQQQTTLPPAKREQLAALYQKVQRSRNAPETARAQRIAFQKLSFLLDLLHYYEHQNTESPDVIFAQRLPALIEQLVLTGPRNGLDKDLLAQAEEMLAHVVNPDHRQMIINNLGKTDPAARTLKFVLKLRTARLEEADAVIPEFIRHLVPGHKVPPASEVLPLLRHIPPATQALVIKGLITCERVRKDDAEEVGKQLSAELGLKNLVEEVKAEPALPPEIERQMAWSKIKDLIARRSDPATVAAAIRERLNSKYDTEEIRQSWLTLIDAEPLTFIRIFCQVPYRSDGRTDGIARPVLETYVTRLVHEKYAATYRKVVNSLRTLFAAKPDSPTLVNFVALVRWVSPEAADRLAHDIGMTVAAH
ncbi:MAG TPA: hypothetical protein VG167_16610 [Verrucomicrobiae bacterium]|nr:hypothetical protein [Verrucomicrobiae bacterium]